MRLALKIIFSIILGLIFVFIFQFSYSLITVFRFIPAYVPMVLGILVGLIFYFLLSSIFVNMVLKKMQTIEEKFISMNIKELSMSILGTVIGLIIANLAGIAFWGLRALGTAIVIALNILLGYMGFRIGGRKKEELSGIINVNKEKKESKVYGRPKILDTSVIIDGRILDLLQTGFIEGKIIIPNFVLQELRHIADSSDSLKRNRGRRGLDILNEIQKQLNVLVEIVDSDIKEPLEVDIKLLKLAQKMDAFVVTNDFNLNKVADFQGVSVLNINELANAIKPVVLPGEDMSVAIIKDGKENGQGIGYLNDGTMIVVEGGNKHIGETIEVLVTSVLQTAAGRMIFTKSKIG